MFLKVFLYFCVFRVFVQMVYFLFLSKKKKKKKTLSEAFSRVSRELAYPAKMTMAKIRKH